MCNVVYSDCSLAYSRVPHKTGGNLILFWMIFLLNYLIRDFFFIKSPPVFLFFKKKIPPTLLIGTPVILGTLEYVVIEIGNFGLVPKHVGKLKEMSITNKQHTPPIAEILCVKNVRAFVVWVSSNK